MSSSEFFSVLLAGGSGTRFWPASRQAHPKQLLQLLDGQSLLRATMKRQGELVDPDHVLVLTSEALSANCQAELGELPPSNFFSEPVGRNTAASVAWAAVEVARRDPTAVFAVLPSDHVIPDDESYRASMRSAIELASKEDVLVTFGVEPTYPATGYGYIEADAAAATARLGRSSAS